MSLQFIKQVEKQAKAGKTGIMGKNFTQGFKGIFISITFIFLTTSTALNAQSCSAPTGLNVTNLSNYSATANWALNNNVGFY